MLNILKKAFLAIWAIVFLVEVFGVFLVKFMRMLLDAITITDITCEKFVFSIIFYFFVVLCSVFVITISMKNTHAPQKALIFFCVLLSLSNVWLMYDKYEEYKNSLFTVEKWEERAERRYIANNMINVISLKHLNREKVIDILGEPDQPGTQIAVYLFKGKDNFVDLKNENQIIYYVEPLMGEAGVALLIVFDNEGNVESYDYISFRT